MAPELPIHAVAYNNLVTNYQTTQIYLEKGEMELCNDITIPVNSGVACEEGMPYSLFVHSLFAM